MRIQFDIKEKMHEIVSEILHSKNWKSIVEVDNKKLKKVVMNGISLNAKTYVDIWENEIHIKTPKGDHTYRIFSNGTNAVCEYIGDRYGLLKQRPFPKITPQKNIQNMILNKREDDFHCRKSHNHNVSFYECKVNDEYIKDGMPMPTIK